MALELIKISEFPESSDPKDWIVVSDASGVAYKLSKENLKAFLGTVTVVAPKPITPTDPAPTLDGVYKPTIDGVYANAGGITVDRSEGGTDYGMSVEIIKNGSAYVKVSEPLPIQDISDLATKEELLTKLSTGSFEDVAEKVITSKNLFNKANVITGKVFNQTLKKLTDFSQGEVTGFIPVEPGVHIRSHTGQIGGYATDDPNAEALVTYTSSSKTFTVTEESGVKFILQTLTTQGSWIVKDTYQLERGAVETPYVPYSEKWEIKESELPPFPDHLSHDDIVNSLESSDSEKVLGADQGRVLGNIIGEFAELSVGKNLFNKANLVVGKVFNSTTLTYVNTPNGKMTGKIKVKKGATYTRTNTGQMGGFANEDDQLAVLALPNTRTFTIPLVSDVNYIDATITTQGTVGIEDIYQIEEGTESTSYEPYTEIWKIKESALPNNSDGTGEGSESLAVEREKINTNTDNIKLLRTEIDSSFNSLLSLEGVETGEIVMNIPAIDHGIDNYVMRVALHFGAERGTPQFDDVFFDSQCRPDFADLRFEDEDGNFLDFDIHSSGNFDVVRDTNLGVANMGLSTGEIIASDYRSGLRRSNDNAQTWTVIDNAMFLVFVDSRDYIFACNPTDFKVYRFTAADNYAAPTMVLDLSASSSVVQSMLPVDEDSDGNIYMGKYQGAWDAEVFKSTDGGLTFVSVYQSIDNQHVHNIVIDKINNTVYVGLDGSGGGGIKKPRCIKSIDGGLAWTILPIPTENADYGVVYCGDGFRLCGGETIVLGGPTIYKTTDDVNFYPVLQTLQGIRRIVKFGDMLIAGGNSARNNRIGQLYASYDDAETWETIYAENWIGTDSVGAGLRNFSNIFTPTGTAENQILLHGEVDWNPLYDYKPLRIFMGGDNSFALSYVKVGSLPLSGRTIKAKWGYPVKYPIRPLYEDFSDIPSLIFRVKTDEGRGGFLEEKVTGDFIDTKNSISWVGKPTERFGSIYPFVRPVRSDGILFNKEVKVSETLIIPNRNFTVCFWANVNGKAPTDSVNRMIIGNPNGVHLYVNGFRVYVSDGNGNTARNQSFYAPSKGSDLWIFYAVTVDNGTIPLTGAQVDDQYLPFSEPLTGWNPITVSGATLMGGNSITQPLLFPIADLRVFNKALSQEELRNIYFGSEYLALNG